MRKSLESGRHFTKEKLQVGVYAFLVLTQWAESIRQKPVTLLKTQNIFKTLYTN
jgi:hypothetical protein